MIRRLISNIVDYLLVIVFSFLTWAILESATGTCFNTHFVSEHSATYNVLVFALIFLPVSLVLHLVQARCKTSVGK